MKIGFVGAGNMAAALAGGWAALPDPPELAFTDAGSGRAQQLADQVGGVALADAGALATDCDWIVLAVKPAALADVAPLLGRAGLVVSVLGATSLEQLRAALGTDDVLRVMPNVGVEAGAGVVCHAPVGEADRELAAAALGALSEIAELVELPEDLLDAATAVMGCSPAYVARLAGAIATAGAAAGLDPVTSARLVALTTAGTGRLLERHTAAEIATAVASPGGSTEAGLKALSERDFDEIVAAAVTASLARMRG